MLGIGLSQLHTMQATPITYSSSAAAASRPVPLFSDPRMAFQNIFGCVAGEKSRDAFLAETEWFREVLDDSAGIRKRLSGAEAAKFDTYLDGLRADPKAADGADGDEGLAGEVQTRLHRRLRGAGAQRAMVGGRHRRRNGGPQGRRDQRADRRRGAQRARRDAVGFLQAGLARRRKTAQQIARHRPLAPE